MIPLPVNPNAVVLIENGQVKRIATNVDREFQLTVVSNETEFKEAALGKPFNFVPTTAE